MKVKIKKLHEDAVIPSYSKAGDAGMDLYSIRREHDKYGNCVHYTGVAMEIPDGHVGLLYPRSSNVFACISNTSPTLSTSLLILLKSRRALASEIKENLIHTAGVTER